MTTTDSPTVAGVTDELIRANRPEIAPLMEDAREAVRALKLNRVEKIQRASRVLDQITNLPSAFGPDLDADEKARRGARRNQLWAERYALEQLEGECHLTPERRAELRGRASAKLPEWERYAFAAACAKDYEADRDIAQTATARGLAEWAQDRESEVADYLSCALNEEEIALLVRCQARSFRCRARFRIERKAAYGRTLLVDARLAAPRARIDFRHAAEGAATLADLKVLCAAWATECRVERRDGVSVLVADGFEIHPAS